MSSEKSESSIDDGSAESSFLSLQRFFFLSRFFFFDEKSDNDESGSGSSGMFPFTFYSVNSVGRVNGSGYEMLKCSFPFFNGEMVNYSFPSFDGEMVNCSFPFFDGEMGKVGQVTEIFSRPKNFHSFKLIFKI